ncbi:serine/threonine-protein kinase [Streptomyces hesseae]|uniref:Serine/threonine-protein kinase n=1 Tax=Streptomyces hesseae TaxID=3075519 RepID=A0ABU2SJ58_9ACTN|nr:serine/threonine-protein kinase [Streptomyces sp. DSM 40473]MDT0449004.1 serine/threonine-protein kinase [Streptomyces sp. DSM 40473]
MQQLSEEDPQVIGAYRLLGRLGAGGMGRVYLGRSAGGRTVAVKAVHPHFAQDTQFRARFRREVESARKVGGAWTAPVLDADPEAAVPWVATGYVAGPSLTEAVAEVGPLPEPAVRAIGAGLAEALAAVHGLGLVHRDVKPSNVLLALDGPRLIDFGIARATDGTASLTATGVSIGSPGYMAPEQIVGKDVTGAADVFSLGAVLTYAATGEPPFTGDSSAALLYKVVHEEPVLGPALTGELRELVRACLAKPPSSRPTPADLARHLAGPPGASALIRPGWLPGPLVERVSRQAVELLDLDASAPPAFEERGPGGGAPERAPSPHAPTVTAKSAAVSIGTRKGRGCTLALTVVGALAVATTAALFAFGVLPGTGGGGRDAAGKPAPPAAGASPAAPATVLTDFAGTWTGQVVQSDGTPNGTMTSVITDNAKAAYAVRTTYDVLGVIQCHSKARLTSATTGKITLEESTDGSPGPGCTGQTAAVTYTLAPDGTIAFASDDAKGGNVRATLKRSGG